MRVPSYDDLTPSIPDVHPRDTFAQVTRLVTGPEEPVVQTVAHGTAASGLFACLRSPAAISGALFALARDFSPRIQRHGDGCVVADVSGLGRLLGDAHGIAAELQRTADQRGLKVRLAVAPSQTTAQLLSSALPERGSPQAAVVTGDGAAALAVLSLGVLETLAGDDRVRLKIFDVLRRWGLRTIGELAALPADELAARFGAHGLAVQRLARGVDAGPLVPDPGVPRFIQAMELEWPIEELEPLSFVLARLLDPLTLALEKADKGAAAIRLDLRLVTRETHTRALQLPASMRDPRVLRTLLLLDLESHPPAAGIDVVTIEVDPAPGRIVQFSLLEHATPSPETLATLTARLNALVGETRCGSAELLDSHRPDAFAMRRFAPGACRAEALAPGACRAEALAKAGPSGSGGLRRFRPPVAIRVAVERGRPVHIPVDRKGMPGGRVEQSAGPWRTSGGWWDATGAQWDRDEWDVALADGAVCRIYRERDSGKWFLDGVLD